jgi:hypothetical protein
MSKRTYTEREMRLALEWASFSYRSARVISRYRILSGELPSIPGLTADQARGLLKPTGLMADLVIETKDLTLVVEAKTDNETQAIGQLLYYVYLMRKYPELQDVDTKHLVPVILLARRPPDIEEFAQEYGVAVAYYSPPWIQEFLVQGYQGGP